MYKATIGIYIYIEEAHNILNAIIGPVSVTVACTLIPEVYITDRR